jgi:hypothetical protein
MPRGTWASRAVLAAGLVGALLAAQDAGAAGPTPTVVRSSGLFSLPSGAASVDWAVANHSRSPRRVRVTVFKYPIGAPRSIVAPGAIEFTVPPGEAYHNANSVGPVATFAPGYYYEVVMGADSRLVLPIVQVWADFENTVIPGTAIPSGSWVALR